MKLFEKILILIFFLATNFSFGQEEIIYNNLGEYLFEVNKNFKIESEKLYFISDSTNNYSLKKPSFLYFVKDNKMVTVEEISKYLEMQCPPRKLVNKLNIDLINRLMSINYDLPKIDFKNLKDNSVFDKSKGKLFAIFLFSTRLGEQGLNYIKQRKKIEKLGIPYIILTIDKDNIKFL
jgi:hypothetical protein